MTKILFICHDANRTGAPILLLNLLRWFKTHQSLRFEVLIRRAGELNDAFEELGSVSYFEPPPMPGNFETGFSVRSNIRKCLEWLGLKRPWTQERWTAAFRRKELKKLRAASFDTIYSNTVVNGEVLDWLSELNVPVISHVHELENVIELAGEQNWSQVTSNTDHFIAASQAVCKNLVERRRIERSKIEIIHEFIPVTVIKCEHKVSLQIRNELGIPKDAFVVCGSGIDSWRKGTDLFVQLLQSVSGSSLSSPFHFIWVGGWITAQEQAEIEKLAINGGVSSRISFTGNVENPQDYFCAADVFAMVSREDPFPLVCLESAAAGKPILCFKDAGGMPEFVETDAGFVLPYLDVEAMADKLELLNSDRILLERMGERARVKALERHGIESNAEKILKTIRSIIEDGISK